MDSNEFARHLLRENKKEAQRLAALVYPPEKEIRGDGLVTMLKSIMWNEFYLGTYPMARQLLQIYDRNDGDLARDMDLVMGLADQIRDEVKHAKLFSSRIEELGGNPNITEYVPSDQQLDFFEATYEHDNPACIAGAAQLTAEAQVQAFIQAMIENDVVDARTQDVMHKAETDEANHLIVGRRIISRFATDDTTQDRVRDASNATFEAIYSIYGKEYEPIHPA